jgi:hypothetical protein
LSKSQATRPSLTSQPYSSTKTSNVIIAIPKTLNSPLVVVVVVVVVVVDDDDDDEDKHLSGRLQLVL